MHQNKNRKIQKLYGRTREATEPAKFGSSALGAALTILLATVIVTYVCWRVGFLSTETRAVVLTLSVFYMLAVSMYNAQVLITDFFLLKTAIRRLQYGDWDYLYHVVLERPVHSRAVLADPGVSFIIGHLFRKLGYHTESQELISHSVNLSPALASITFERGDALSANDESKLMTGLEHMSKKKFVLWVLTDRRKRRVVIVLGVVLLFMFYAVHVIKIIGWLRE